MKQSLWRPSFGVGAIVAVGVVFTLAACADIPAPQLEGSIVASTPTQVGPMSMILPGPDGDRPGWAVQPTVKGVTDVDVTVCAEDAPCPGFSVVVGAALPEGFTADDAWLPADTLCPGVGVAASGALVSSTNEIVGGKPATQAVFDVTCVDDAGDTVNTVQQRQWLIQGTPVGDVAVVDLWSIDDLPSRLESAQW